MVRIYSGATKQDILNLKELWFPVSSASNPTPVLVGEHTVALVDAVGEYAVIEGYIPRSFNSFPSSGGFQIYYIGVVNAGAMTFDWNWDFGGTGEAYNVHSGTVAAATVATIVNQINAMPAPITGLTNTLAANDVFALQIAYNAAVPATNIRILGAAIRWV